MKIEVRVEAKFRVGERPYITISSSKQQLTGDSFSVVINNTIMEPSFIAGNLNLLQKLSFSYILRLYIR